MEGLALSSGKQDLIINPPMMNSAGVLGFAIDPKYPFDFNLLGAFVTHPISLKRRAPAKPTHFERYPGGALVHTGLPNPGARNVLLEYRGKWEDGQRPVIAHVLAHGRKEMETVVDLLENVDHPIQALEIGLENTDPSTAEAILTAANLSQLPLLARLPPDADQDFLLATMKCEVNAVVLGPPRGSLVLNSQELVSGRLYGPGMFPFALNHLGRFLRILDIPVIMGCGLYTAEHLHAAFDRGAAAVQLDMALWLDPDQALAKYALFNSDASELG